MPKDYQISQYDIPINVDGWLDLPNGRRIGIVRAHLEEDTGKTTHVGGGGRIHDAAHSLVDYNRAGVPLVEIVSAPDLRSAEEARAYVDELRGHPGGDRARRTERWRRARCGSTPTCRSGRPARPEFGTRCEIKNLNSLRSLGRAIDYEAVRQIEVIDDGGEVVQETRHWDEASGRTGSMRSKEEAYDYRYFPEPDLVPVRACSGVDRGRRQVASRPCRPPGGRRWQPSPDSRPDPTPWSPWSASTSTVTSTPWSAAGGDAALAVRRLANEVAAEIDVGRPR